MTPTPALPTAVATVSPIPGAEKTAEPEATPQKVGDKVFCLGNCKVMSSKKINDTEYETIVDLDEQATKWLEVCFSECKNVKHMVIKTNNLYENNKTLNIVITKDVSTFSIIDAETIKLSNFSYAN